MIGLMSLLVETLKGLDMLYFCFSRVPISGCGNTQWDDDIQESMSGGLRMSPTLLPSSSWTSQSPEPVRN